MSAAKRNLNKAHDFWAKAQKSYSHLECLKTSCLNLDWQTTVCFYTALQMMKAYILVHHGKATEHHEEIKVYLPQKPHIRNAYGRLKELASNARYEAPNVADTNKLSETLHYKEAEAKLKQIHNELCARLDGFTPFIP